MATLTFSTIRETRKNTIRDLTDTEDGVVIIRADPLERAGPDGSRRLSMGFPVAILTGWVSEADKVGQLIADLLTEHYAKGEGA